MKDIDILKEIWEEELSDLNTMLSEEQLNQLFVEISSIILENNDNIYEMIDEVIEVYIDQVKAIAKLSPGLSTGILDIKNKISINTYNGQISDEIDAPKVTEDTIFDIASMTKFFTALLLLKEEEKGNIDLNKTFEELSPMLKGIDIPVIEALKFKGELQTPGRLDEEGISAEERIKRFKETFIHDKNTYRYSDIPYMLVPLLFGKDMEKATENYLKLFYDFYRDELELTQTGYSTIDMTGGIYEEDAKELRIFDPKARLFEREVGYVPAHAGVTTTVKDLEKLFERLMKGLLSKERLKKLLTTISPESNILLDENGLVILRNNNPIKVNHSLGVYPHIGDIAFSNIGDGYSEKAFAAAGSTGSYSVFDLENGLFATFLSNIKSGLFNKKINTEDYLYGYESDELPKHFETTLIAGTKTLRDGRLLREDGTEMIFARATNNFKEEQFETLLKLRIIKKFLITKALLESQNIKDIEEAFNRTIFIKSPKVLKK